MLRAQNIFSLARAGHTPAHWAAKNGAQNAPLALLAWHERVLRAPAAAAPAPPRQLSTLLHQQPVLIAQASFTSWNGCTRAVAI